MRTDTSAHDALKRLIGKGRETTHRAGQPVAAEGAGPFAMHVVLEGTAAVSLRGEKLRDLGPGDHVAEISMIDGRPRSATVTATTDLGTLAVSHVDLTALLDDDPTFAGGLLLALCARLREAEAR